MELYSNKVLTGTIQDGYLTGRSLSNRRIRFTEVDGFAIFEGDIVLGLANAIKHPVARGLHIPGDAYRWLNGVIPYTIDQNLPNQNRVTNAIQHWEQRTSIRFVQRTNELDFVHFRRANGCWSYVGRIGGQQDIGLANGCTTGSTIHEIGHAVGLWHEQSREDRDQFITINLNNISQNHQHNFNQHVTDGDDVGLYDYNSIMHYGAFAFAINNNIPTIVAPVPIGQRNGLNGGDIEAAEAMYKLPSRVQAIPGWFGTSNQGGDIAIADINGNGQPDIVVLHIDNPSGENHGYYRIGWNIDEQGRPESWSDVKAIPSWFGAEDQGAGIAVADISGNGRMDLIVFHIDNPGGENHGYYRIGRNLDNNGNVTGGWSAPLRVPGWFGAENQGAAICIADISRNGRPDLLVFHLDNPGGENHGYYRIGWNLSHSGDTSDWSDIERIPGWFGAEDQGAGVAVVDISGSGQLDLIVFHLDNPGGENHGYYRVGRNLDNRGNVTGGWGDVTRVEGWFGSQNQGAGIAVASLQDDNPDLFIFHIDNPAGENRGYYRVVRDINCPPDIRPIPGWFGASNQGADICIGDINGNGRPDLVVLHIDNPSGENHGYYRIGWDLDDQGRPRSWGAIRAVPGWFGSQDQGSGVAVSDVSGTGVPDLIVFHLDNPGGENHGYYRIGWNINRFGDVTGGWSALKSVPGWFGAEDQGAAIAIADINGNGKPDLLIFHLDNPRGENHGYYRIGWDMNNEGDVSSWSDIKSVPGWFGAEDQGAGVALGDVTGNGTVDIIVFHLDNPNGENHGYYRIGRDLDRNGDVSGGAWGQIVRVPGWFGASNQGAGIAVEWIRANDPDLFVMHIDNPRGENRGYYRVVRDLIA